MNKQIQSLISKVDRKQLKNNTQRALLTMLTAKSEWLSPNSFKIPNVTRRLRELRQEDFGGFQVECQSGKTLNKRNTTARDTFYRLVPTSITKDRIAKALHLSNNA